MLTGKTCTSARTAVSYTHLYIRDEIHKARAITDKPLGMNIMLLSPNADDLAQLAIDEKIEVLTTGAGNPGKYMEGWKSAGIKVMPVVASVALAKRMARAGADAVIAEGMEGGGHIGELTTMPLVPQVVDAVDVPVIAAGGKMCIRDRYHVPCFCHLAGHRVAARCLFLFSFYVLLSKNGSGLHPKAPSSMRFARFTFAREVLKSLILCKTLFPRLSFSVIHT